MKKLILPMLTFLSFWAYAQQYYLFVGTYTYNNSGSKGIYVYRFDADNGDLTLVSNTDSTVVNPTYLAIAPKGDFVYATTETRIPGKGSISAFAFDAQKGTLKFINKQPSGGDNPSYLAVNKKRTWIVTSNFSAGSLAALPINADGSLNPYTQLIQHRGEIDDKGKEAPHVHATIFSADEKYVVVPDPGEQKIAVYGFYENDPKYPFLANPYFVNTRKGSFPRHFEFHPNGKFAYSIQERDGTVVAFSYKNGKLDSIQVVLAHDTSFHGPFVSSDIHVSPDGKFVYAANRGSENNIAIFAIDQQSGKLILIGLQPTLGKTPRNFVIEPSGKFILVGNQETGTVVVFKRNVKTGLLTPTGKQINVPQPAVLKFLPITK